MMASKGQVLNRNESQSQLTANLEQNQTESQEVELRAQSNENSQIFMESQFNSNALGNK